MPFQVKARILLELGAELISSDAIALYELIKNSIDAGSKKTEVKVDTVLKHSSYVRLAKLLMPEGGRALNKAAFLSEVEAILEPAAPDGQKTKFLETLQAARTTVELRAAFEVAYRFGNKIDVRDNGHGMAFSELKDVYLTVGTPSRLLQRRLLFESLEASDDDPNKIPLGEKGIGRLAAMRLGDVLELRSATKDDRKWNHLSVNWAELREDINIDLSNFSAEPKHGKEKSNARDCGTTVRIRMLLSDWTKEKLNGLAQTEFSKLFDPFAIGVRKDDIRLSFNGEDVDPPAFERRLLKHADATCSGEFRLINGEPVLSGKVNYSLYKREKTFHVDGEHLVSVLSEEPGRPRKKIKLIPPNDAVVDALRTLGPFEWEFHWYNRGRMQRDESDLWQTSLRAFVALWSGGLLVYRDGYRVYPYGSPDDDWLDLDRKALSASAYKLNRTQIIGRLKISSRHNPQLQDQTNREGFRDCPEKYALVRLLRHVCITECRTFLEDVNDDEKPVDKDDLENIERRMESSQKEAVRRIRDIGRRLPNEKQTVSQLLDYLRDVSLAWEKAKEVARTFESELEKYIHLAGVGLMVEFIAHELTRATQNALLTLGDNKGSMAKDGAATMETLRAQLKTIEKRLRVLDTVSIPGRQRRSEQDIRRILEEVLDAHTAQFDRHDIKIKRDPNRPEKLMARVEKGQIVQIFENLISNAVYWLREKRLRSEFSPIIEIRFDSERKQIAFQDNGPGIPEERGEEVFNPFFTTKPPGKGRGLGLYIASKLAEYNDATLKLDEPDKSDIHRGFVLSFREQKG